MSEFGKDLGLMHEVTVTGRKVGADREFWTALAHNEELFARVVAFATLILHPIFHLLPKIEFDKKQDGWQLERDSKDTEGNFHPRLAPSIKGSYRNDPGPGFVMGQPVGLIEEDDFVSNGYELFAHADGLRDCCGQRHAEAMLRNPSIIPTKWREFILVFPETCWKKENGNPHIPTLRWNGKKQQWELEYFWVGSFLRKFRMVRFSL